MQEKTHISRSGQTMIYLKQCFRSFVNDKGWKIFISSSLIAFLICLVTSERMFKDYDDTRSGAFALICACIWIGIFNSIRTICREKEIVKREKRTGLHMSSYILAHLLYEAVLCLAESVLVTMIVRVANLGHFIQNGILLLPTVELFITLFLVMFSADALGLLISSVVKDENTAMTVMPFALIIQLIMSGMVFELEGASEIISYFTISRWGLNAICASADVNHMTLFANDAYQATVGNLLFLWGILFVFAAVYGIVAVAALHLNMSE
ncbi:MAG: ABC transporter permease [Eubacteriales bacterium]|nr:ABC transporter permease [Eubacteriales bacterium]